MTLEFNITGMACASCQHNIQKTVSKIRGVRKVNVNLVSATMSLECDEKITPEIIINKVKSIGYGATLRDITNNSNDNSQQVKKN